MKFEINKIEKSGLPGQLLAERNPVTWVIGSL